MTSSETSNTPYWSQISAHPLEIAGRWHQAPPCVLDRLQENGRHRLGPFGFYSFGNLLGGPQTERLEVVLVDRGAVEIGVGHRGGARDQRLERLFYGIVAGYGQGPHGDPVVRNVARNGFCALWLPDGLEILPRQLPGRLDRFTAASGEEDTVYIPRRQVGQTLGQFDGRRVGIAPQGEVCQLLRLASAGLGQLAPTVARLYYEKA